MFFEMMFLVKLKEYVGKFSVVYVGVVIVDFVFLSEILRLIVF